MIKSSLNDTFNNLKNTIKSRATSCASSVKARIDLANEESRQAKRYQILGEHALDAILDGNFETLREDPEIVELIGCIQEKKLVIEKLEKEVNGK